MDVVGSAVGIASLGIQICQGLLTYYDGWKDYKSDIGSAYDSVADLSRTLILLQASLDDGQLDIERTERAKRCIQSCKGLILKLSEKCQKLRTHSQPEDLRQKAWVEVQRVQYPFRKSTLVKLQELVHDITERLQLAVQVLQLDVGAKSQRALGNLEKRTADLHDKFDLSRLHAVYEATFDSYSEEHNARCLAGTRLGILQRITDWVEDWDSEQIFWLHGGAGTGKSTISRTVAHDLHERGQLGASFFCRRGEGDRSKASRLFTTIAGQLAQKSPSIRQGVIQTLKEIPDIAHKAVSTQFDKLIFKPLTESDDYLGVDLITIIDALDEIDSDADIGVVLNLFRRLGQARPAMRLRLFVTSRPEIPLRSGFAVMAEEIHRDIALHEVAPPVIEHDIALFVKDELASIRRSRSATGLTFLADWPGEEATRNLVQRAVPLFIFAATTCRFIGDRKDNPKRRLRRILDQHQQDQLLSSQLDQTYQPVLEQLLDDHRQDGGGEEFEQYMKLIGSIVLLADPLSAKSIAVLLRVDYEDVCTRLDWLHSVLSVPKDPDAPIRPLHLSFREFLVDSRKRDSSPFWVDERGMHDWLATRCIKLLSEPARLKQDLCNVQVPGARRADISNQTIRGAIPAEMAYACRYWVYHVLRSDQRLQDGGQVDMFLRTHLLHWIEALSLLSSLWEVLGFLDSLISLAKIIDDTTKRPQASALLESIIDARRFVSTNIYIIDNAPLQIYASALVFSPKQSNVRNRFRTALPKWLARLPPVPRFWGSCRHVFEGHSGWVRTVVFSPDGTLVASGSNDETVRLWDAASGQARGTLEGHSGSVSTVVFSPDGTLVASGSDDKTVRLWDAASGQARGTLEGHSGWVSTVVFSPDGTLVASGSGDKTVRLWDAASGQARGTLEGYLGWVDTLVFSPDGKLLFVKGRAWSVQDMDTSNAQSRRLLPSHGPLSTAQCCSVDESMRWITVDGMRVLWLPPDVRPGAFDIKNSKIAVGNGSGRVTFIHINVDALDTIRLAI